MKYLPVIALVFIIGNAAFAATLPDSSTIVYDDTQIHDFELQFWQPGWWDTLVANFQQEDLPYMPARFIFNGVVYDSVGVRFKGNSSYFGYPGVKKSFKIKFSAFKPDQRFYGLKTINLNNGFKDPSFLREKMFLDFLNKYIPSMRSNFARLTINGVYWGLYINVEQVNKGFLQSRFGENEDGNLYKGDPQGWLIWLGPDPEPYQLNYEKKTNETQNDWSDLIHFIDVLNNTPLPDLPQALEKLFRVNNFLKFLAMNNLFVNLDSYVGTGHNYYLYHQDFSGKFIHIPWDVNEAFGNFSFGMPLNAIMNLPIFWLPPPNQPRPLVKRLWDVPEYRTTYLRYLNYFVQEEFREDSLFPRIDTLHNFIRAAVYADTNKMFSDAQFEQNVNDHVFWNQFAIPGLKPFIITRRNSVIQQLQGGGLGVVGNVYINEILAENQSVIADEAGEYDPCIELYNDNPGEVNLLGMYLSDDAAHPEKWKLPELTVPGKGFRVLWLDGDTLQGPAHVNFTLNGQGGFLQLSDIDITLVDSAGYPTLPVDVSYGRLPDGSNNWFTFQTPTLGFSNETQFTTDLVINEFMASNDTTIADEFGEYDDWVEIFNPDTVAKNLLGLYLTDDLSNPTRWAFPDTTIPPGGFLLIWTDDDPEQGPLHTTFKLSASGEQIGIFNGVDFLDSLTFGPQTTDISYGRLPDGGINWQFFTHATPGYSNATTSIQSGDVVAPEQIALFPNYPNPFNSSTQIRFRLPAGISPAQKIQLTVYDLLGRKISTLLDKWQPPGDYTASWDGRDDTGKAVSSGLYLVQLRVGVEQRWRKILLVK